MQMSPLFQTQKAAHLSNSYAFFSTHEMIQAFSEKGWEMRKTYISKVRKESKKGFQKHMVRFSNPTLSQYMKMGNRNVEILMRNSHYGDQSVILDGGIFEFVCSNGLVISTNIVPRVRIRHSEVNRETLFKAIENITMELMKVCDVVNKMMSTTVSREIQLKMAKDMAMERIKTDKEVTDIDLEDMLHSDRPEEQNDTLWAVMNKIQEKLIRGGIKYSVKTTNKKDQEIEKRQKTRRTNNIDLSTKLNSKVFEYAYALA